MRRAKHHDVANPRVGVRRQGGKGMLIHHPGVHPAFHGQLNGTGVWAVSAQRHRQTGVEGDIAFAERHDGQSRFGQGLYVRPEFERWAQSFVKAGVAGTDLGLGQLVQAVVMREVAAGSQQRDKTVGSAGEGLGNKVLR